MVGVFRDVKPRPARGWNAVAEYGRFVLHVRRQSRRRIERWFCRARLEWRRRGAKRGAIASE
jgi:hypothetical protein